MRTLDPNPGWMQLTAKTASGGGTPLYISSDKNPFQIQRERESRLNIIRAGLEQVYPGEKFYSDNVKSEPSLKWKELPLAGWTKNNIDAAGLEKSRMAVCAENHFNKAEDALEWFGELFDRWSGGRPS
eukprot:940031-Pyramimonas_sp.AAC.1